MVQDRKGLSVIVPLHHAFHRQADERIWCARTGFLPQRHTKVPSRQRRWEWKEFSREAQDSCKRKTSYQEKKLRDLHSPADLSSKILSPHCRILDSSYLLRESDNASNGCECAQKELTYTLFFLPRVRLATVFYINTPSAACLHGVFFLFPSS